MIKIIEYTNENKIRKILNGQTKLNGTCAYYDGILIDATSPSKINVSSYMQTTTTEFKKTGMYSYDIPLYEGEPKKSLEEIKRIKEAKTKNLNEIIKKQHNEN